MGKLELPGVGMRTIKTAVAVVLSYLFFVPFQYLSPGFFDLLAANGGAFYACIAAVICLQSSVGKTVHQGVSRLIGTGIGGLLGLLVLTTDRLLSHPWFLALMLGLGTVLVIWLCNVIRRPAACSIAVVVLCVILFNHSGPERYIYAVSRMFETAVGVVMAIVINYALPDHRKESEQ